MKVAIIGFGHIGKSLWKIEKQYHQVYVCNRSQQKIAGIPNSTTDAVKAVTHAEIIQVCFPVEVDKGKPDVKKFLKALEAFREGARRNALLLLESTVPVTTTEKAAEIFNEQYVAHSPVRGSEPHMVEDITKLPKIVGGVNRESTEKAVEFYRSVHITPKPVEHSRVSELFKLANNVWQDVNIAYANELARIAAFYNVEVDQVLKLVASDPERKVRWPGYVGGHCIPDNPHLLTSDLKSPLVDASRKINERVISWTVEKVRAHVAKRGAVRIAVLGVAYKPNVESTSNSAAVKIIKALRNVASEIWVYDPKVDRETLKKLGRPIDLSQVGQADLVVDCHGILGAPPEKTVVVDPKRVHKL